MNINNLYITGDKHRNFKSIEKFCKDNKTTTEDLLIVLGDFGVNYFNDVRDMIEKERISKFQISYLLLNGNHELRPENIPTYITKQFCGGTVMYEPEYPNIMFLKDGEIYNIKGETFAALGGAYSVDKFHRLSRGMNWFPDEQMSKEHKNSFLCKIKNVDFQTENPNGIRYVLTHTCPYRYRPTEVFLPMIAQETVDDSMEKWLDEVESILNYEKWYAAHFHINKSIDKIQFVYDDFIKIM